MSLIGNKKGPAQQLLGNGRCDAKTEAISHAGWSLTVTDQGDQVSQASYAQRIGLLHNILYFGYSKLSCSSHFIQSSLHLIVRSFPSQDTNPSVLRIVSAFPLGPSCQKPHLGIVSGQRKFNKAATDPARSHPIGVRSLGSRIQLGACLPIECPPWIPPPTESLGPGPIRR